MRSQWLGCMLLFRHGFNRSWWQFLSNGKWWWIQNDTWDWQEVASQVTMVMMCCLWGGQQSKVEWGPYLGYGGGSGVWKGRWGGSHYFWSPHCYCTGRSRASACLSEPLQWGGYVGQGTKTQQQAAEVDICGEEIEGEKVRVKRKGRYTGIKCRKEQIKDTQRSEE